MDLYNNVEGKKRDEKKWKSFSFLPVFADAFRPLLNKVKYLLFEREAKRVK